MRIQQRFDEPDRAMRGPAPGGPRFTAPRPGFAGQGRGMPGFQARPQNPAGRGMPPMYRPPVQNAQPKSEQEQMMQQIPNDQSNMIEAETQQEEFKNEVQPQIEETKPILSSNLAQPPSQLESKIQNKSISQNNQEEQKQVAHDMPLQQQSLSKPMEIKETKPQEETKTLPASEMPKTVAPPQNGQQQQASFLSLGNNRLIGMINGLLGMLTKKKAYTGRPASAMKWDEKKKRYIIDGEDESDDDIPPPPPPTGKKITEAITTSQSEHNSTEQTATSAIDLTRPAMPSHFGARGRGRGVRGGATSLNRFPATFAPTQLSETSRNDLDNSDRAEALMTQRASSNQNLQEESQELSKSLIHEEGKQSPNQSITQALQAEDDRQQIDEQSVLYTTTLDITLRDSVQQIPTQQQVMAIIHEQQLAVLQQSQPMFDEARESLWQEKFSSQQEKINNLKYKMQMLQQELRMQRDENEQTIENFTTLCQDLKFKGLDEVEDLQSEMSILKEHLKKVTTQKAEIELRQTSDQDALLWFERENQELRERLQSAANQIFELQISQENQSQTIKALQFEKEEAESNESNSLHFQSRLILDLQAEVSSLRWQKNLAEAEKLSKQLDQRELMQVAEQLRSKLREAEVEKQSVIEEQRRNLNDALIQHQDQVNKLEREKDTLREMIQRVQQEKERLSDQQRERFSDYDARLKLLEEAKQKTELEASKVLRDKDVQIEQLKNKLVMLNQAAQIKDTESAQLKDQVSRLEAKIQQLLQKRQTESEMADSVLKSQLKQIQDMLQQKNQEIQLYESKQNEFNQEIESKDTEKYRLTQNIIYLQNEIRKRDELLESSDFGDFELIGGVEDEQSDSFVGGEEEDRISYSQAQSVRGLNGQEEDAAVGGAAVVGQATNTSQSIRNQAQLQNRRKKRRTLAQQIQNQLDETRGQLKQQIEEKMRAQRAYYNLERNYQKLADSLSDISTLLDQQQLNSGVASVNNEQSSMAMMNEEETKSASHNLDLNSSYMLKNEDSLIQRGALLDELQHQIIQKIFTISRHFESEMSEQHHKMKLMQMQLEESENLKFDIEFLTEEKTLNEQEIQQLKLTIKDLEYKISELKQLNELKTSNEEELRGQLNSERQHQSQLRQQEREKYEKKLRELQADSQSKIDEVHQTFKTQLLPQIKAKHDAKYSQMQEQFSTLRQSLTFELEEQKRLNESLEEQQKSLLNQTLIQQESEQEERDRLRERINYLEIQNQESLNQVNSQKAQFDRLVSQMQEEQQQIQQEKLQSEQQFNEYKESLESYYKEAALKIKDKYDQEKKRYKELKNKFKGQLELALKEQQENFDQSLGTEQESFNQKLSNLRSELELQSQKHQELVQSLNEKINQLQSQLQTESQHASQQQENSLRLLEAEVMDLKTQLNLIEKEKTQQAEEFDSERAEVNNRIEQLQSQIQDLQSQLREQSNLKDQEDLKQLQISQLKEQLLESLELLEQRNDEIQSLKTDAVEEEDSLKEMKAEVESLKAEISNLKQQISEVQKQREDEVQNIQSIARTVKAQLTDQNAKLLVDMEELRAQLKEQNVELRPEEASENQEVTELKATLERIKEENKELQDKHSQLIEQLTQKSTQLDSLQEELSQSAGIKDQALQDLEKSQSEVNILRVELQKKLKELQEKQAFVSQEFAAAQVQEEKNKLQKVLNTQGEEHKQEVSDLLAYYNERENELKQQAVQAAEKLKSDLKKQKEKVKSALKALEQLQGEREQLELEKESKEKEIEQIQSEKSEIKQKYQSAIKDIGDLSKIKDKSLAEIKELEQDQEIISRQLQEYQQSIEQLETKLISQLNSLKQLLVSHHLIESSDEDLTDAYWEVLLQKIGETLSNYEEDRRSIKTLIDEKEELQSLRDQYQAEKESVEQEKSIIQEKFENSNAFKLQQKVQVLEEERSEMRSDFYIKINSYVQEIDSLREKLSRFEESSSMLEDSKIIKLGDDSRSSLNNDKSRMVQNQEQTRRLTPQEANQTLLNEISRASGQLPLDPSFMDQSKMSQIENQHRDGGDLSNSNINQQQKSGLFTSIASFFLTESQLHD